MASPGTIFKLGATFSSVGISPSPPQQASQTQVKELRGVWLTNIGAAYLYQTTRVDEVLHQ